MSVEFLLYLIDLLSHIDSMCFLGMILSFLAIIFSIVICFKYYSDNMDAEAIDEANTNSKLILKKPIISFIIFLSVFVILPSKKTMYMMALANYSKKSEVPEKVLRALEVKLDEIIERSVK